MEVHAVPVLEDNISYIVVDRESGQVAVVDPAVPETVMGQCERLGLSAPSQVWTTHKHADHAAGNPYFAQRMPHVEIIGGRDDHVPACTKPVTDRTVFKLGNIEVTVLAVPCHTRGHVLYYAQIGDQRALFTGDTLFIGGCGRFFEGSAKEMHHNLNSVIASLPGDTLIYCGHEYTVANLRFANRVEPDNGAVREKLEWAMKQVASGHLTVPSTIDEERTFNPFMRVGQASVRTFAGKQPDDIQTMAKLREIKNMS